MTTGPLPVRYEQDCSTPARFLCTAPSARAHHLSGAGARRPCRGSGSKVRQGIKPDCSHWAAIPGNDESGCCAVGEGPGDGGGAARHLQPAVDVLQVGAHSSLGNAESAGDLPTRGLRQSNRIRRCCIKPVRGALLKQGAGLT
jgi:hypothetical protein